MFRVNNFIANSAIHLKLAALTNHCSNVESFLRYIDLKTSEGLKIFNSALHGFESPLAESAKINLVPQDFQKLSDHLNRLGNQFVFDYLFKRAATTRTIIPAIPVIAAIAAIPADPLAVPPILAQPRVPAVAEVPEVMRKCLKKSDK